MGYGKCTLDLRLFLADFEIERSPLFSKQLSRPTPPPSTKPTSRSEYIYLQEGESSVVRTFSSECSTGDRTPCIRLPERRRRERERDEDGEREREREEQ
mmetsp:Transcript_31896/g.68877  ORF Transcript_31896/g.68877 Transcript_31896/m.68877 type:complete len:99 (+) Transcript_31896:271-567(+)